MKKVFVANYNGQDMSPAERFGQLVYLTEGSTNIFNTNKLISEIKDKLDVVREDDFLLVSGHSIVNIIASSLILFQYGLVNVLIYDAKTQDYVPQTITETRLIFGDSL